jgi:hypothetical protein
MAGNQINTVLLFQQYNKLVKMLPINYFISIKTFALPKRISCVINIFDVLNFFCCYGIVFSSFMNLINRQIVQALLISPGMYIQ